MTEEEIFSKEEIKHYNDSKNTGFVDIRKWKSQGKKAVTSEMRRRAKEAGWIETTGGSK